MNLKLNNSLHFILEFLEDVLLGLGFYSVLDQLENWFIAFVLFLFTFLKDDPSQLIACLYHELEWSLPVFFKADHRVLKVDLVSF